MKRKRFERAESGQMGFERREGRTAPKVIFGWEESGFEMKRKGSKRADKGTRVDKWGLKEEMGGLPQIFGWEESGFEMKRKRFERAESGQMGIERREERTAPKVIFGWEEEYQTTRRLLKRWRRRDYKKSPEEVDRKVSELPEKSEDIDRKSPKLPEDS
ncbi:hypothetical protein CDAR_84261 [Caerostris darwini]|uniref:Uncharacterized protein n=1 Tax=Caerostris darwini TaxID=1538125 RepID=A0AAV4X0K0_9ARAC|nr:hypothetical protein CDAR_84261 [Caerostris darwini]